nr:unnamed protein product [Callosobruchus analis]
MPYRCRIRPPAFIHLSGMDYLCKNQFLADAVAVLGEYLLVL